MRTLKKIAVATALAAGVVVLMPAVASAEPRPWNQPYYHCHFMFTPYVFCHTAIR